MTVYRLKDTRWTASSYRCGCNVACRSTFIGVIQPRVDRPLKREMGTHSDSHANTADSLFNDILAGDKNDEDNENKSEKYVKLIGLFCNNKFIKNLLL